MSAAEENNVRDVVAAILAKEPDDAAVASWETMSDVARAAIESRALDAGLTAAVFLAEADATRIAAAADPFDAIAVAKATRRS